MLISSMLKRSRAVANDTTWLIVSVSMTGYARDLAKLGVERRVTLAGGPAVWTVHTSGTLPM